MSQYVENGSRNNKKNQKYSNRQIKDLQDDKEYKIENNKHSQVKSKKEEKKNIFVVGDSMLKNITGSGISRDHTVKIRPHPWASTVDVIDYIKPELRHKPDIVILNCATNDITNYVIRLKRWRSWSKKLKKMMVQRT